MNVNGQYHSIQNATGEPGALLRDTGLAAKRINVEVYKAVLECLSYLQSQLN